MKTNSHDGHALPSTVFLQHAQLLDSALPIGAFSHSFGLETLVLAGQIEGAAELEAFVNSALSGPWSQSDCLLVKGAFTLENADLWRLDTLMNASRVSRETREGMCKMGRQGLKLARSIHPQLDLSALEGALRDGACAGSWPLVYGIWARELGVSLERAALGYLQTCCAASLGNAVRLSLVGQTAAQAILASLPASIDRAWHRVAARDPFAFSSSLPRLEIAQMGHEWLDARLFMS